jgi:outer membrane autotransporter protein
VINKRGSSIAGATEGIVITGGRADVVDSGTIIGTNGTAILFGGSDDKVTLETGANVIGDINGGDGFNRAYLKGTGEYDYNFTNFSTLTVRATPTGWNLTGTNTITQSTTVEKGLLQINGTLTTPLLTVDANWNYWDPVVVPDINTPWHWHDRGHGHRDDSFISVREFDRLVRHDRNGLAGAGTIIGNVDDNGYISPGVSYGPGVSSIGTLTIIGSLTTSGDYFADINPFSHDLVDVSGTAKIDGGKVILQTAPGIYAVETIIPIVTATNGVTGTYDSSVVVKPTWTQSALFPLLGSSLLYDPNNVYLELFRTPFASVAKTYNQHSVAGALDGVGVVGLSPTMSNLVTQFYWLPTRGAAQAALDSMSGEIHGTLGMLDVQQQDAFNSSISERTGRISTGGGSGDFASNWKPVQLASAGSALPAMPARASRPLDTLDIWMHGFGQFGGLENDGNASGGNFTISGLSGGLDFRLRPELLVGLGLGYSHDSADVGGPGASGGVDAYQLAGYAGYINGPWHLDGIFSYGFLQTDTKRYINVGDIQQTAYGNYDGGVLSASAEGGYAVKHNRFTFEPTLGLNYTHVSQDSFNETGAAADGNNYGLNVNSVNMDSLRSALGARLDAQFGKKDGVQFIPGVHAGWEHEFLDQAADVNAKFIGGSGDFIARGIELGRDTGILGVALTVAFNKEIQGSVNYDARVNNNLTSQTISGRFSVSW